MIRRRPSAWQKIVALAPLLLVVVSLPSQVMLRCRIDGQLRSSCCCPSSKEQKAPNSFPTLVAQDCCDRELLTHVRPVATSAETKQRDVGSLLSSVSVVLPIIFDTPEPQRSQPTWRRHGPPREGPPLILLKHAFLI